jgi:hypothetical protein
MNERIKELLYESGGEYGGEHYTTGQPVIYTDEVDYEKFAELTDTARGEGGFGSTGAA